MPFLFMYNVLAAIFNAMGDSRTPLYLLILSSVLNVGLDILSVTVFGMGDTEKSIPSAKCVVFLKYPVAVTTDMSAGWIPWPKICPLLKKYESVRQRAGTHMDTAECVSGLNAKEIGRASCRERVYVLV